MGPIGSLALILPGRSTIPAGNGFDAGPATARRGKATVVTASAVKIPRVLRAFSINNSIVVGARGRIINGYSQPRIGQNLTFLQVKILGRIPAAPRVARLFFR